LGGSQNINQPVSFQCGRGFVLFDVQRVLVDGVRKLIGGWTAIFDIVLDTEIVTYAARIMGSS